MGRITNRLDQSKEKVSVIENKVKKILYSNINFREKKIRLQR